MNNLILLSLQNLLETFLGKSKIIKIILYDSLDCFSLHILFLMNYIHFDFLFRIFIVF